MPPRPQNKSIHPCWHQAWRTDQRPAVFFFFGIDLKVQIFLFVGKRTVTTYNPQKKPRTANKNQHVKLRERPGWLFLKHSAKIMCSTVVPNNNECTVYSNYWLGLHQQVKQKPANLEGTKDRNKTSKVSTLRPVSLVLSSNIPVDVWLVGNLQGWSFSLYIGTPQPFGNIPGMDFTFNRLQSTI